MYTDVDREMELNIKVVPKSSVIGREIDQIWSQKCSKSMQKWSNTVPEWSSGRLVAPLGGHVALLDQYADQYAEALGRFGNVFRSQTSSKID